MNECSPLDDELRPEYDESVFKDAVRGKYAKRCAEGTNMVRLAPDVAADFPTAQAVNDALRFVKQVAQDANRLTTQSS